MAEGVALASGEIVDGGVFDDRNREPAPDPVNAPLGWRWDRSSGRWMAKQKPGRKPSSGSAPKASVKPQPVPDGPSDYGQPDRDPEPGWMREPSKPAKAKAGDVPQKVKDDIAGFAGMAGIPLLGMLQQIDPFCGGALAEAYPAVVDACLPLICRSEKVVAFFSGESNWTQYLALAIALRPVASAVVQHHVLRTVQVVRDEHGRPVVIRRVRDEGHGDHLTPDPQPEFSYEA